MNYILETQHKSVPWRWVTLMVIFGMPHTIGFFVTGSLVFTIKKFIDNPAAINGLTSLDVVFNIVFAATVLYISDRIWTRYGRRKIFMIPAYFMIALSFMLLPMATNIYTLIFAAVLWYMAIDIAATFDTLKMELIPPHQRGRWSAMNSWAVQLLIILFFVLLRPRFDDVVILGDFRLSGEAFLYWVGSCTMIMGGVFLMFFIKERKPAEEAPDFKGGFFGVYRSIFADKRLFPVYLLMFCFLMVAQGLESLDALLVTEQWGYSKQDLGTNILTGGLINLIYIPILGLFVDKFDKIKIFAFALIGTMLMKIAYYIFVQFVLPDNRPEIHHMIFFGQGMSMFGWIIQVIFWPLVYDYIPRDKMGTAQTGLSIVKTVARLILINGVGLWVTFYSFAFLPEGTFDYFSAYIFLIITDVIGVAIILNFIWKVKSGKLTPVGKQNFKPVEDEEGVTA